MNQTTTQRFAPSSLLGRRAGYQILLVHLLLVWGGTASAAEATLWYDRPAQDWEKEALPIGNGRLGAMLFGGAPQERIQFNEESLWIGDETDTGAYQAFGDVFVDLEHGPVTEYRRELDLERAVHTVTYESGGVKYRREAFASFPAQVLVFRFTADKPGALTGIVTLTDMHKGQSQVTGNRLRSAGSLAGYQYEGNKPYAIALHYEAQVLVLHDGGTVEAAGEKIAFKNANSVTLLLDAGTDFVQDRRKGWRGELPHGAVTARLDAAAQIPYEKLLADHLRDYQALFDRVTLDLGPGPSAALPTGERLVRLSQTRTPDPGLEALLFQYGRYLLIASSRPGGLPANLQGKWNQSNRPPWRSDYHTDINVQMNYWPADVASLSECFEPLCQLAELDPRGSQGGDARRRSRRAVGRCAPRTASSAAPPGNGSSRAAPGACRTSGSITRSPATRSICAPWPIR